MLRKLAEHVPRADDQTVIELISGININTDKRELVASLVSFCHAKGIKLVAEGIETKEELAEVIRLGIDFGQGFYMARPQFDILPLPTGIVSEIRKLSGVN